MEDTKPTINDANLILLARFSEQSSNDFVRGMVNSSIGESFRRSIHDNNTCLIKMEIVWNVCFLHYRYEINSIMMPDGSASRLTLIGSYKTTNDLAALMHSEFKERISLHTSEEISSTSSNFTDHAFSNLPDDHVFSNSPDDAGPETDGSILDLDETSQPKFVQSTQPGDVPSVKDFEDSWLTGNDDDVLMDQWFTSNVCISIETIWKQALSDEPKQQVDVDHFLPKDPVVSNWLESVTIKSSNVSCSLKSFLDKESGVKHIETTQNSHGKQNFAMVKRFFSFAHKFSKYHHSGCPGLNKTLLKFINDDKFVIAFFLLLLRYSRCQKTLSRYVGALTKTVEYLTMGGLLKNSDSYKTALSTLDIMSSARKVADQRNRLKKTIRQAERLENFDMDAIKKLLDVAEFESYFEDQGSINLTDSGDRNRFLKMQGYTLFVFRTFNASHLVDLEPVSYKDLQNSLNEATGTTIILDPSTKFKQSQKKTNTIFHLSVPIRYKRGLQLFLDARRKISVNRKELFVTSRGTSAKVANFTSFINLFVADKGMKDIGTNAFRHYIETSAESQLQRARTDVIGFQEVEQNRAELSSSLLHSAKVAKQHYIKLSKQKSAYRCIFIDQLIHKVSATVQTTVENNDPVVGSSEPMNSSSNEVFNVNCAGNEDCSQIQTDQDDRYLLGWFLVVVLIVKPIDKVRLPSICLISRSFTSVLII